MSTSGTAIETVIPGASYSSGVFQIPISALNSASSVSWDTPNNSIERLTYCLLQSLYNFENTNSSYDANTNLWSIVSRSLSTFSWADYTNSSSVMSLTFSTPFVSSTTTLDPDALGANS